MIKYRIGMGLKQIDSKIKGYYNSADDDILNEFYIPVLSESIFYRRITGFFSSNILAAAARGISNFIKNGGRMELVCWAALSEEDIKAIKEGLSEENVIEKKLSSEIDIENIEDELKKDHLRVLAWMIKNNLLEIKIAIKTDSAGNLLPSQEGMFHPKSGLFRDSEGNELCFSGSDNESVYGWIYNIEEFHVYKGWKESDKEHFLPQKNNINEFWENRKTNVRVFSFPEALKRNIISVAPQTREEIFEMNLDKRVAERLKTLKTTRGYSKILNADSQNILKPYYYQQEAIMAWKNNGCVGLLSMATGTGKTYTALFAIENIIDKKPILILVPTVVLLEQWMKEISKIYPDALILSAGGKYKWKAHLTKYIFVAPKINKKRFILATMKTASSDDFIEFLQQAEDIAVIVDEAHRVGSPTYRVLFDKIKFSEILGLSATPERLFDEEGNKFLKCIFGDEPVFKIDLGSKIKISEESKPVPIIGTILSKYEYHFEIVKLEPDEEKRWRRYTEKINKLVALNKSKKDENIFSNSSIQNLLIKRARILKKARQKIYRSAEIIEKYYSTESRWIVYCEDSNQLRLVKEYLKKQNLDIPILEYHSQMTQKRKEDVLSYLEDEPCIVVSIRCLDEGVDIPAVDGALLLASSKNPREYIQRRGRVLRRARNKKKSIIVDTIVLPSEKNDALGMPIVKGELARAYEFSKYALNREISHEIWRIGFEYGVDLESDIDLSKIGIEGGVEEDE